MNISEAIRRRLSIKEFTDTPVPRERIEALLELAVLAPNHRMTDPLEFRVLGPASMRAYAVALADRKARSIDDPDTAARVRDRMVRRNTSVPSMIAVLMEVNED